MNIHWTKHTCSRYQTAVQGEWTNCNALIFRDLHFLRVGDFFLPQSASASHSTTQYITTSALTAAMTDDKTHWKSHLKASRCAPFTTSEEMSRLFRNRNHDRLQTVRCCCLFERMRHLTPENDTIQHACEGLKRRGTQKCLTGESLLDHDDTCGMKISRKSEWKSPFRRKFNSRLFKT